MKKELRENFEGRVKQILKTSLNSKNITKAINTYAVPVLTYSFGIVRWNDTELEELERRVRIWMTENRWWHPKSAIERLTLLRYKGERGITSLKWLKDCQIMKISKYFQKKKEETTLHKARVEADRGITTARLQEVENNENGVRSKGDREEELIQQWRRKVVHGKYPY